MTDQFKNARFDNPEGTQIVVEFNGSGDTLIPVDGDNRHYRQLIASGVEIAPFVPHRPTPNDVREEADRRMRLATGARDTPHMQVLISNASREAIRLLRKGGANWTDAERDRAEELDVLDDLIEAIRASSNAMEENPPLDYTDDKHWP